MEKISIYSWVVKIHQEYFNIFLNTGNSYRMFQYTLETCKLILNNLIYSCEVESHIEYFNILLGSVNSYRKFWYVLEESQLI